MRARIPSALALVGMIEFPPVGSAPQNVVTLFNVRGFRLIHRLYAPFIIFDASSGVKEIFIMSAGNPEAVDVVFICA